MRVEVSTLSGYVAGVPVGQKTIFFLNWVTLDKSATVVFRCSQPYYNGHDDTMQTFDKPAISLLNDYDIKCVISLNHHGVQPSSLVALSAAGIEHYHLPVADFQPPTINDLMTGCQHIDRVVTKGQNALIYCGHGSGRTGTMDSAYEIYLNRSYSPRPSVEPIIKRSTAETDAQEKVLRDFYAVWP